MVHLSDSASLFVVPDKLTDMVDPKHAVSKAATCDIEGCDAESSRSISGKKVEKAGFEITVDPSKNAHLCKEHYKQFKKKTKTDREYERLGR